MAMRRNAVTVARQRNANRHDDLRYPPRDWLIVTSLMDESISIINGKLIALILIIQQLQLQQLLLT